jgi:hypothetical protein
MYVSVYVVLQNKKAIKLINLNTNTIGEATNDRIESLFGMLDRYYFSKNF